MENQKLILAKIFMEQCIGKHPGDMANKPNNPIIMPICIALGAGNYMGDDISIQDQEKFADILINIGNELKKDAEAKLEVF